ncbi:hypothetical protein GUJ93_ZPchr0012g21966 [Zizania palustris]|uniref:Uncharacterized protein n=1 Tax=Zizania palustris TaxID=103762 RepID=A0A8J5WM47_ZIZPA|nr:hypothetical protein GUJ93_ZPchr0012g21966 [Zizania palustris]
MQIYSTFFAEHLRKCSADSVFVKNMEFRHSSIVHFELPSSRVPHTNTTLPDSPIWFPIPRTSSLRWLHRPQSSTRLVAPDNVDRQIHPTAGPPSDSPGLRVILYIVVRTTARVVALHKHRHRHTLERSTSLLRICGAAAGRMPKGLDLHHRCHAGRLRHGPRRRPPRAPPPHCRCRPSCRVVLSTAPWRSRATLRHSTRRSVQCGGSRRRRRPLGWRPTDHDLSHPLPNGSDRLWLTVIGGSPDEIVEPRDVRVVLQEPIHILAAILKVVLSARIKASVILECPCNIGSRREFFFQVKMNCACCIATDLT